MGNIKPEFTVDADKVPDLCQFRHKAMNTVFEIYMVHSDHERAEQIAWEAFDVLVRLEGLLSPFIENSDISRINEAPPGLPVLVDIDTFDCISAASRLYSLTAGCFDLTTGSLIKLWKNRSDTDAVPADGLIEAAMEASGMDKILLDEENVAVTRLNESVRLDTGGIGKGFALDCMAKVLREWDIEKAIIFGSNSSILALGPIPDEKGWPVRLYDPLSTSDALAWIALKKGCISSSGTGKGTHIVEPRTGKPALARPAAWAMSPDATSGDALSTSAVIMSEEELKKLCKSHPEYSIAFAEPMSKKLCKLRTLGRFDDFRIDQTGASS